jgi:hypothetical protein
LLFVFLGVLSVHRDSPQDFLFGTQPSKLKIVIHGLRRR